MNWKIFELKYNNREQWAFEQMSYLLFCSEFENKIGLFRYKNQTGIETEPFEKNGKYYGFQAKFYTSSISQTDIVESIEKAKSKNPQLNVVYLYTNVELSESSKKTVKKPKYQIEIEDAAKKIDIEIYWKVPSHFELQLALPENKYIYDLFFNLNPNNVDLINEIYKHNDSILQAIKTEINYESCQIKIDRSFTINQLNQLLDKGENIIISGEGGCGKTAIVKEFYNHFSQSYPICIYKASEFNVNNINELLEFHTSFTFKEFFEAYGEEKKKVLIIDSAEKLAELATNDILNNLIFRLKENGWILVFTTRYSYLNDLTFHIKENYQLSCKLVDISLISKEELILLSKEYEFILPDNVNFSERLTNLFYLNEYIRNYTNIDKSGNFRTFIDVIWKTKIQNNSIQRENLHIERGRCLLYIAKQRCDSGLFYIKPGTLPQTALFQLKQDEIIGYNETHDGYFITHDIYEEWALNKIVSQTYANHLNVKQYFEELGSSLPIRRAFRLWLSEQLSYSINEIEEFIQNTFISTEVSQYWRDELIVSVLLSNYAGVFFNIFEKEIIDNDFKILKRVLFLLRIACTEISTLADFDSVVPKGKGWEVVIEFINKHKSTFFENNTNIILPIIDDWTKYKKNGQTTRIAGLLALSIFEKTETIENFYIQDKAEEKILEIIYNSAAEITPELKNIFDKVIVNKWTSHNSPYEGLCTTILNKPYLALEIIKVLPQSVLDLCDLFWQKHNRKKHPFESDNFRMEAKYGLADEFRFNYSPASAYQTPIYWLLQHAFYPTLDFIINFTDRAVELYRVSDYGRNDVREIVLHTNRGDVKQYLCWAFWGAYRGFSSPVVPYLLQSIHMALEKILLELSQIPNSERIELILLKLLQSKSTSLTSIVCSIVLSNPDKFYNVALVLFKTLELFHIDASRNLNEFQAKSLYSIGYGLNRRETFYHDERLKTCEDLFRNSNLETIFLNYQFSGIKGFTEGENAEFINKLYEIIDSHKESLSHTSLDDSPTLYILLARMDRRNLTGKIVSDEDNKFTIEFTPNNLSDLRREEGEQKVKDIQETFKYSFLRTWADVIHNNSKQQNPKHLEYDNNPLLALSETKQLIEELEQGRNNMGIFDDSIPAMVCSNLMINFNNRLCVEDRKFCKDVIMSSISRLFSDDYNYQIGDGVEIAIHAIPALIDEYPEEEESFVALLILTLFDKTPIGYYKRVCDYAIETIGSSKMWELSFSTAQKILSGFIYLKPIYNNIYKSITAEQDYLERISKNIIFTELEKQTIDFSFDNILVNVDDVIYIDIYDLEIIYQIIPANTKVENHLQIYQKTLPQLLPQLLQDRRRYRKENRDVDIHRERLNIFKRFAEFILEREMLDIDIYLKPFKDCFQINEETTLLINEIISAEDRVNHYERFWYIWNSLCDKFIELAKSTRDYYLNEITASYLLAWQYWKENIEEWQSLKKENMTFYKKLAQEIGNVPAVLYSISKMLNSIGSKFEDDGIEIIFTITSNNRYLNLGDLHSNTEYYLEIFMRKFIFKYRKQIKQQIRLKNKILTILDFMIERGSIHGYLLRESIL